MTEYWVSKKQYWCKYCSIWNRDDAPSRRQHETGLRHLGNKELFVRDLYKGGDIAKREKAQEAAEMARIETAALAAHANDRASGSPSTSKPSVLAQIQASRTSSSTSRIRDARPKDKWANYSTAKQLGFDDEDTQKSSYEIEQEIKGRAGDVGAWETVEEPPPSWSGEGETFMTAGGKRKLGEYDVKEEEDGETFKFSQREKRAVRDVYDDDDWDPRAALKGKVKREDGGDAGGTSIGLASGGAPKPSGAAGLGDRIAGSRTAATQEPGLQREGWSGRLEMRVKGETREGLVYLPNGGGWVKAERGADEEVDRDGNEPPQPGEEKQRNGMDGKREREDIKPDLPDMTVTAHGETVLPGKGEGKAVEGTIADLDAVPVTAPASSSLFKKRRPPPGAQRKK